MNESGKIRGHWFPPSVSQFAQLGCGAGLRGGALRCSDSPPGAAGMWQWGLKRTLNGLWLCTQVKQPALSKMVTAGDFWLLLSSANPRVCGKALRAFS